MLRGCGWPRQKWCRKNSVRIQGWRLVYRFWSSIRHGLDWSIVCTVAHGVLPSGPKYFEVMHRVLRMKEAIGDFDIKWQECKTHWKGELLGCPMGWTFSSYVSTSNGYEVVFPEDTTSLSLVSHLCRLFCPSSGSFFLETNASAHRCYINP